MMRRLVMFLSVVVAGGLLPARVAADEPAEKPQKVSEALFVLYALEDMYEKDMPKLPEAVDPFKGLPQNRLKEFFAQRQFLFDHLRRHVERSAENNKLHATTVQLFREYEKRFDVQKSVRDQILDAYTAFNKKVNRSNQEYGNAVGLTAVSYGLGLFLGVSSLEESFEGFTKVAALGDIQRNQVQTKAYADLVQKLSEIQSNLPDLKKATEKNRDSFKKIAEQQSKDNKWEDTEFAFQNKTPPKVNPFRLVGAAQRALADKKNEPSKEELLVHAKACMTAAEMVPDEKVYDFYRAAFYAVAGQLANRAAEKDLGATGFAEAMQNPARAAAVAKTAWEGYFKYEPVDVNLNTQALHRYVLAIAYGGDMKTAAQVLSKYIVVAVRNPRTGQVVQTLADKASFDPQFWYDCARVFSVTGGSAPAVLCLQRAKQCGFAKGEEAKLDPDLKPIRQAVIQLFP
jgi:hypothetical protein